MILIRHFGPQVISNVLKIDEKSKDVEILYKRMYDASLD